MRRKLIFTSLVLFVLLSCSFAISVEASSTTWSQTYGGEYDERAYSLVETSDGGYAIVGTFGGVSLLAIDVCFVKTNEFGNLEWNWTYEGADTDSAYSVVETRDGGYALAGYTTSFDDLNYDFWLVKTDAYGDMEWNRTYGGAEDEKARCLVATSDGGFAIAGRTSSFGAGSGDWWLVKTDEFGNMEWNQTYGGAEIDEALSFVEASDGGYAITGFTRSFGAGSYDFWLVKTNSTGYMEWNQTYGGANGDTAYSLVETSDGGYAIGGYTSSFGGGGSDFWLVKTNSTGYIEWNQTYGGTDDEYGYTLVETSDGGYAIAGSTETFGVGKNDFWLVKTNSTGYLEWNQTYGGAESDTAWALIEISDGEYAIAGTTGSFGAGSGDFWLIKTGACECTSDFDFEVDENTYNVAVSSNSTVIDYNIDQDMKQISFTVIGLDGTTGFCNVTVPEDLLWGDFTVYVNETALVEGAEYTRIYNGTHNTFSITYNHSSHLIEITGTNIVPEYSSWLIPTLLLTATLVIIVSKKRLPNMRS